MNFAGLVTHDRLRLRFTQHRHPVDLAAGQQERANAIDLGGVIGKLLRVRADGLDVGQFAIVLDTGNQRRPCLAHGGFIGRAVQQALVDAPCEGVGVETG